MDESRPIFMQIAEQVENDIIAGSLAEEAQVPSINEFAAFYRINPATALKGIGLLVDAEVLYKKRGIGMFVSSGARERLLNQRRDQFSADYPDYAMRHRVPVGLTGLAQVSGLRGDTPISDRARFDNYYIENWSLWLDVKVILRTVAEVLRGGGR